ncbi:MAG: AAA family ATPase [Thermodesulfobacteriota bacterium]
MQIKSFRGHDIQEVLQQVKKVFGPEALIITTKTIKPPPDRLFRGERSIVEVVAAAEFDEARSGADKAPKKVELDELRPKKDGMPWAQNSWAAKMCARGLLAEFVAEVVGEYAYLLRGDQRAKNWRNFQDFVLWRIMQSVAVTGVDFGGKKIWAFVGPTGVGKTTTLAKLAALYQLRYQKKIALITLDIFRIGAIEQLQTYAQILQVPLQVAKDRETLRKAIRNNADRDLVFIDTAGRSPQQQGELEELRAYLDVDEQLDCHLVLSATTKDADLMFNIQQFNIFPVKSYIFTKIDETRDHIAIFNQLWRFKTPVSFMANGQRVPEDIELATKGKIANLVMQNIN